jgi:hypothetical protein
MDARDAEVARHQITAIEEGKMKLRLFRPKPGLLGLAPIFHVAG